MRSLTQGDSCFLFWPICASKGTFARDSPSNNGASLCGSPGISGGGSLAGFGVGSVTGCGGSKVGSPGGSCIGLSGGSRSGGAIGSWRGFVGLPGDMGTLSPRNCRCAQSCRRGNGPVLANRPAAHIKVTKFRGSCLLRWRFCSPRPSQPPSHRRRLSGRRPSALELHLPP